MATFTAGQTLNLSLDYDDTISFQGQGVATITPTSGSIFTTYLTGNQTIGPFKQYVSISIQTSSAGSYSQSSLPIPALVSTDGVVGQNGISFPFGTVGNAASLDAQSGININRLDPLRPDSVTVASTGMVKTGQGYFLGFKVISATGLTVAFADQASPTAQRSIATYAGLAPGDEINFPGSGYPLLNGLYATFTGTGVLSVKVA